MVNPGTPEISADLVRTLLRSRGKISGATLTCAAAALLGCPEATDDEKVRFYMFLIKRLEQIATDDECRANVHKLVRYPDEVKGKGEALEKKRMAKLMDDGEWMLGRISKCRRKKVHAIAGERADAGDPKCTYTFT